MLSRRLRIVLRKRLIARCDELSLDLFPRFCNGLGPNGHLGIANDLVKPVNCLLLPTGFAMQTHVSTGSIGTRAAARSLASIGLRAGDIFTVSDGCRERHYEIRGPGGKP